jgi:Zn-dependent protease
MPFQRPEFPPWPMNGYIAAFATPGFEARRGVGSSTVQGVLPLFLRQLLERPTFFVSWVIMVVFSVCLHEFAHAYVALSQGDDTAVRRGYLTLDPLKLMGYPSLIALACIGIAWGQVPVTPSKFRYRYSHALVAVSGPGTNLALAICFAVLGALAGRLLPSPEGASIFRTFFLIGARVNCLLAALNILPIPMFDGWEVAALFVPALNRIPADKRYIGGWIALLLLFMTSVGDYFQVAVHVLYSILTHAADQLFFAVS